jgi:hypothetical protein
MKEIRFEAQFVEFIPEKIEERVIYVSMEYGTAIHKCPCGCGEQVVTAFSPTDWSLHFDGATVSLDPSVGNWNFPCRSHYYIRRGKIVWAGNMSAEAIERGRVRDRANKRAYFEGAVARVSEADRSEPNIQDEPKPPAVENPADQRPFGFWRTVKAWFAK